MPVAVEQRRQHPQGEAERLGLLLLDAGDPRRPHALELMRIEARPPQHIGEERERRIELILERRERTVGAVERGAGIEECPE